jgi:hypothetical protein
MMVCHRHRDGLELGVQAALRAPDPAWSAPFSARLAAVWWAFRFVASIINRSGFGPSPTKLSNIRQNTPTLINA